MTGVAARLWSYVAVAPTRCNFDPSNEISTATNRHTASGSHESLHRLVRMIWSCRDGIALGVTIPVRMIEPANAVMRGSTQDSQRKNSGMATSKRACAPIVSSEKTCRPTPSMNDNAERTVHRNTPSASPNAIVFVFPRTSPIRHPSWWRGPPSSEKSTLRSLVSGIHPHCCRGCAWHLRSSERKDVVQVGGHTDRDPPYDVRWAGDSRRVHQARR